jgi:hypothetical protein
MDDFSILLNQRPLWVRFDPEDRDSPAPDFCLPACQDGRVCRSDFRGDCSLLIYFVHSVNCADCRRMLADLASRQDEIHQAGARLLVVFPPGAEGRVDELPDSGWLADVDGSARAAYAGLMAPGLARPDEDMLFILDEFGGLYTALLGAEKAPAGAEAVLGQVLSWLEFISIQCPE